VTATKPTRANLSKLAAGIPEEFVHCKKGRSHDFVEQNLDRVHKGRRACYEVTERCTHCPTKVITWTVVATGERLSKRKYIYPEGYLTPGIGNRGTELREVLRLNTYRRMEQRKKQATSNGERRAA
jgi:hypothetical protein